MSFTVPNDLMKKLKKQGSDYRNGGGFRCPIVECREKFNTKMGVETHLKDVCRFLRRTNSAAEASDANNIESSATVESSATNMSDDSAMSTVSKNRKKKKNKKHRWALFKSSYQKRMAASSTQQMTPLKVLEPLSYMEAQRTIQFEFKKQPLRMKVTDVFDVICKETKKVQQHDDDSNCSVVMINPTPPEKKRPKLMTGGFVLENEVRRSSRQHEKPKRHDDSFIEPTQQRRRLSSDAVAGEQKKTPAAATPSSATKPKGKKAKGKVVESEENVDPDFVGPPPPEYFQHVEKTAKEVDEEIEYDMDDEDSVWLEMYNRPFKKSQVVTEDAFELIMDRFEKEAYFMAMRDGKKVSNIDEDAVCCICLDGECLNTNAILFCDRCNLAVHQECYGVPYIPEGQWLCRRCLKSPSIAVSCVVCPNKGGAFKQTDDGRWCHVICTMWLPEISFANLTFLEPIEGVGDVSASRWRLKCYICKESKVGACIQCHEPRCFAAFHVTCAQQAGLHMKIEQGKNATSIKQAAYCHIHGANLKTTPIISHTISPLSSPSSSKLTLKQKMKIERARRLLAEARTSAPVIISLPAIDQRKLERISTLVKIDAKKSFMKKIHAYWILKRQSRAGVPLIRRLQSNHDGNSSLKPDEFGPEKMEEIKQNLRIWQQKRVDLERVRTLVELIKKREKLKREVVRTRRRIDEIQVHPLQTLLYDGLTKLRRADPEQFFYFPVDPSVPEYYDEIQNPMDFQSMERRIKREEYRSFEGFKKDVELIIENCKSFNMKSSGFYKAAIRLQEEAGPVLHELERVFTSNSFEWDRGILSESPLFSETEVAQTMESILPSELRREMPLESQLDILLDSMHSASRNSGQGPLAKQLHKEIISMRKNASVNNVMRSPTSRQAALQHHQQPSTNDASRTNPLSIDLNSPTRSIQRVVKLSSPTIKPDAANRFDSSMCNGHHAPPPSTPTQHPIVNGRSSSGRKRSHPAMLSSGSANRNRRIPDNSLDSFVSSSDDEADADVPKNKRRTRTRSDHGGIQPHDIVWAKCPTYPWYPALVVDPSWKSGYSYQCGIRIPQPPLTTACRASDNDKNLVMFFDEPRTWQWLRKDKLELLGCNEHLDASKLGDCKKPRWKANVRRAYDQALEHLRATSYIK